ncbi:cob(I)yrinic acid a,c-diamide adenosyltransferase [Hephaestia sp. GCM10023244]|uniref:cob(I)yrinic acid a,c-diamide adenosyltransferase n=1 Tax=unclassified Hephaestia TaxID=2631281 RepID=UPI002077461F|nr:cob(I)yrinic acid a,c-diamide adenosyltransferase [Hephaestia sp. MAHUQ-44]MCM8730960.1 cob(I)yrinic acid a,c-diamide adenosyltransferase [Hephaestia sp. MAHUQ-44]
MVKLNKIYTRKGDDGTTGLVDGSRRAKNDPRMIAIGDVDETNSAIGVAIVAMADSAPDLVAGLIRIQSDLFDLGADLATPGEDFTPSEMVLRIIPSQVARLETEIDAMNGALAPLTSFILPGGTAAAAALHVARATTRRAERAAVTAMPINPQALAYLNRLSDWLFVAARVMNKAGTEDVLWQPGATR